MSRHIKKAERRRKHIKRLNDQHTRAHNKLVLLGYDLVEDQEQKEATRKELREYIRNLVVQSAKLVDSAIREDF